MQTIENRTVLESFEPLQSRDAEARWVGHDLSDAQPPVRGKRILIVEDEEPLRACLRMMLELEGHQVIEAGNGAEALKLFAAGEFDLVITDFQMPLMEGDKLAVNIKLLAPAVPILMVTASGRARCDAQNPVNALLNKPFTMTELHCLLGKLLSARPEPAEPGIVLESSSVTLIPDEQVIARLPA